MQNQRTTKEQSTPVYECACVCVQGLRDRVIITSWVLLDFKQRDGKEKSEQGQYLKLKR